MISDNLSSVRSEIDAACDRASRGRDEVTLIAVSKTKPVSMLKEAYDAGAREFGENKVQEILEKYDKLPSDIHWHMIGHLQTNKVKYIIDKVELIHGVDSLKLAQEISKQAVKHNLTANILIEINIGNEETKFGVAPESAKDLILEIVKLPNICVKGLMAIAPYVVDEEENRPLFAKMRNLVVDITNSIGNNIESSKMSLEELSMGMTGDYRVAVEEGATLVRVGTGIFGERDYSI